MEKIKKIPVVGYLCRLLYAIIKLPGHLDTLYQAMETQNQEMQRRDEIMHQQKEEMQQQDQTIQRLTGVQEQISVSMQELRERNASHEVQLSDLIQWNADRMEDIRGLTRQLEDVRDLRVNSQYIKKLNWMLSCQYTLWGDESRLHISELAALPDCMLNTNSGHITVGAYTFSGAGVSILAGSHDKQLTGLPRRDAEMKDGCDIVIGDGVWLGSNCTILGPATIGDNAVIAAGAVVTAGTVVPPNTVYAGVPAVEIKRLAFPYPQDASNSAVLAALTRENGVLFLDGWTEKREIICGGKNYIGHYLITKEAEMCLNKGSFQVFYQFEGVDVCSFFLKIDNQDEVEYHLLEPQGTLDICVDNGKKGDNCGIHTLSVRVGVTGLIFFLAPLDEL